MIRLETRPMVKFVLRRMELMAGETIRTWIHKLLVQSIYLMCQN